jgi:hypothetical protein
MKHPKSYSVLEVLNYANVGLIFEFYCTKESEFIVSDLTKYTSKNIILTNEYKYEPSYSNAILLKEYEAKKSRYQFKIAPQSYHSILPIVDSVSKWIAESAQTTYDTNLKISLSFNHRHLETLESISEMNPTRLVLKFDENFVYSRFPEQKYSPYALSIKTLAPTGTYVNEMEISKNIDYILTLPAACYYGIDFSNYTQGILECNYIGGKDYPKKSAEIKEILEYFIIKTYQSLNEDYEFYSAFEMQEMKRITEGFTKIQMAYYDPEIFLKEFANLKVYVDLKTSLQTLKTFWTILRKPLFEMILNGHLREGQFNYDTEIAKFQLRKANIGGTLLKNLDFVKCEITGVLENCTFMNCNVVNSRVYNSKFIDGNNLINSYAEAVSINRHNEVKNSYIINTDEVINCPIIESVIKFATPGKSMTLDENSTMIIKQEPLPQKSEAIQVEEIRDYKFLKDLRNDDYKDKGFQNAYDRNKYIKHGDEKYKKL